MESTTNLWGGGSFEFLEREDCIPGVLFVELFAVRPEFFRDRFGVMINDLLLRDQEVHGSEEFKATRELCLVTSAIPDDSTKSIESQRGWTVERPA